MTFRISALSSRSFRVSLFWASLLLVYGTTTVDAANAFFDDGDTEFDFEILDPESAYGSPYGGFSRATASRLASLPLKLPNIVEEIGDFRPFYMQVKDARGRPFSCRVYHEDELDPATLDDSMFSPPVLKQTPDNNSAAAPAAFSRGSEIENPDAEVVPSSAGNKRDHEILVDGDDISKKLSELKGICAHFHRDWWSYEWCYEDKMLQFHVAVKNLEKHGAKIQTVTAEGMTSLGTYSKEETLKAREELSTAKKDENPQALEIHTEGDLCSATGKPRTSNVTIQCCAPLKSFSRRGTVLLNGSPIETDIAYIKDVREKKTCSYSVTICTPLLCNEDASAKARRQLNQQKTHTTVDEVIEGIENISVTEILELTFRGTKKKCIQYGDGGWWSYELCPGKGLRQFHMVSLLDRISGATSTSVESEHILGRFDPSIIVAEEDEWKYIVNTTSSATMAGSKGASIRSAATVTHGGNGAYFFQEYKGGDICDHEDVTDSAIKAGEVGKGLIERSATIKFGCGSHLNLMVQEDATCHYVAFVYVPTLCQHPFFRAPVSKKQVIRCLPND